MLHVVDVESLIHDATTGLECDLHQEINVEAINDTLT